MGRGFDMGLPYVVLLLPDLESDKLLLTLTLFVAFTQFMLRFLTDLGGSNRGFASGRF